METEEEEVILDEEDWDDSNTPELPPVVHEWAEKAREIRVLHQASFASLTDLVSAIKKRDLSDEELADIGFLLRNTEKVLNDLRIEFKAKKELIGKYLCAKMTVESIDINDSEVETKIDGILASASAKVEEKARLPKVGTPEYAQIAKHFGVNDEAIKAGLFGLSFMKFGDYCTELRKLGRNPPQGVLSTNTVFSCIFRSRSKRKKSDGEE